MSLESGLSRAGDTNNSTHILPPPRSQLPSQSWISPSIQIFLNHLTQLLCYPIVLPVMYANQALGRPLFVATIVFIVCSAFLLLGSRSVREHVTSRVELTRWASSSGSHRESDVFNATLGVRPLYKTISPIWTMTLEPVSLVPHPNLCL